MVWHRIEQDPVHVEQNSFQIDIGIMMGVEKVLNCFFIHDLNKLKCDAKLRNIAVTRLVLALFFVYLRIICIFVA